jgi:hypothetical protein
VVESLHSKCEALNSNPSTAKKKKKKEKEKQQQKPKKFVLSHFLEARSLRSGVCRVLQRSLGGSVSCLSHGFCWFAGNLWCLWLIDAWTHLCLHLTWCFPHVCVSVQISLFYNDASHMGLRTNLEISF